jgi:FKBP-type peptidyl-prolyl cis-trans isomerase
MRPKLRLALSALLLVAAAACGSDDASPVAPLPDGVTFAPALGVDLAAMTRTSTGLYYRDLAVGTGRAAARGGLVSVAYTGWLADGTQFDARPASDPITFRLGVGQVIAGWDEGLQGMREGGRRQLVIPPALGYGAGGNGPIPGNAALVFTVELVAVP